MFLIVLVNFLDKEKINLLMVCYLILNLIKFNVKKVKMFGYIKIVLCIDNVKFGYWCCDFVYYYKKNCGKVWEEFIWDWEGYFEFSYKVIDELKVYMLYIVMDIDKYEVDDYIVVFVKKFFLEGYKILIILLDGDFI